MQTLLIVLGVFTLANLVLCIALMRACSRAARREEQAIDRVWRETL